VDILKFWKDPPPALGGTGYIGKLILGKNKMENLKLDSGKIKGSWTEIVQNISKNKKSRRCERGRMSHIKGKGIK
jgi:hypothetical protein